VGLLLKTVRIFLVWFIINSLYGTFISHNKTDTDISERYSLTSTSGGSGAGDSKLDIDDKMSTTDCYELAFWIRRTS
jgi:hypothetical protein